MNYGNLLKNSLGRPEEAEAEYGAEAGPAQGGAGDPPGARRLVWPLDTRKYNL